MPQDTASPIQQTDAQNELELAAFLFQVIESQITRADTKAGLVVAADVVFVTALLLVSRGTFLQLVNPRSDPFGIVIAIIDLLVFVTLICSTLFALFATRPSLRVRKDPGTLFFFSRIARMDLDEYVNTFSAQSTQDLRRAVLTEVHTTALIATTKFQRIRYSIDFLIVAVILWAMLQVLIGLSRV